MTDVTAFYFWSPTCAPCRTMGPTVTNLKEEFADVTWVSVNTHEDPTELARRLQVVSVPTIVVLKGSTEVGRHSGTSAIGYYVAFRKAFLPTA
jgi:thiol-disulfide isomerase/thioredoxin